MKQLKSVKLSAILLLLVPSLTGVPSAHQDSNDPVAIVLELYQDAVIEFHGKDVLPTERNLFWIEWRERLATVVRENPESNSLPVALVKILGLSNSLGDFETSQAIVSELRTLAKTEVEKARWSGELGEIHRMKYKDTGNNWELNEAVEQFENSLGFGGNSDILIVQDPQRFVIHSCMLAELLASKNTAKALTLWNRAAELLSSNDELAEDSHAAGFGLERIFGDQLRLATREKNGEWAREILDKLNQLDSENPLQQEFWIYVSNSAQTISGSNNQKFVEFIKPWKEESPFLIFLSARSEFNLSRFDDAFLDYSTLRDVYKAQLIERDSDALLAQSGGYYGEVLLNFYVCAVHKGLKAEAENAMKEARELYGKDPRIKALTENQHSH